MTTCFIIQPFDAGKFDKRYDDVFCPAVKDAGLQPYRVDQDASVDIPIDAIETGIRSASVCLADITTDNPNVWYELGYAFALNRPVVMVCSDERSGRRYPFDIQHRTVIPYKTESSRDFDSLKSAITKRIKALLHKTDTLRAIQSAAQVAPVHGLSQLELAVLATVAGSVSLPDEGVAVHSARSDVEQAGFTSLAFTLGLRRLVAKTYLRMSESTDFRGEPFQAIFVTQEGWNWVEQNEDKFILQRPPPEPEAPFF